MKLDNLVCVGFNELEIGIKERTINWVFFLLKKAKFWKSNSSSIFDLILIKIFSLFS